MKKAFLKPGCAQNWEFPGEFARLAWEKAALLNQPVSCLSYLKYNFGF